MNITAQTVEQLCDLARLTLEPEEAKRMRRDLARILEYVEKLSELDTEAVPPTSHVIEIRTPMRDDDRERKLPVEDVTRNAPRHSGSAFVVPKVID
jgi:aspartyl-tRNA(Asn)/glutamyl-tRNA(Gln) amidotransferase subunit C